MGFCLVFFSHFLFASPRENTGSPGSTRLLLDRKKEMVKLESFWLSGGRWKPDTRKPVLRSFSVNLTSVHQSHLCQMTGQKGESWRDEEKKQWEKTPTPAPAASLACFFRDDFFKSFFLTFGPNPGARPNSLKVGLNFSGKVLKFF